MSVRSIIIRTSNSWTGHWSQTIQTLSWHPRHFQRLDIQDISKLTLALVVILLTLGLFIFRAEDFMRRYMWPNSSLPSATALITAANSASQGRFTLEAVENHGSRSSNLFSYMTISSLTQKWSRLPKNSTRMGAPARIEPLSKHAHWSISWTPGQIRVRSVQAKMAVPVRIRWSRICKRVYHLSYADVYQGMYKLPISVFPLGFLTCYFGRITFQFLATDRCHCKPLLHLICIY